MGKRSTWTSKDDGSAAGSCRIWREFRGDRCATKSHCSRCAQTGNGLGHKVGRFEERAGAEGEEVSQRMRRGKWTEKEVHRLKLLADGKVSADSIAKLLKRSITSVQVKAQLLNLSLTRGLQTKRK